MKKKKSTGQYSHQPTGFPRKIRKIRKDIFQTGYEFDVRHVDIRFGYIQMRYGLRMYARDHNSFAFDIGDMKTLVVMERKLLY